MDCESRLPAILNLSEQQKIRIGTCAWSFEEWSGVLYPPDMPSNRWLEFYSHHFPAVEIDSTFYSAPAENVARRWLEMTYYDAVSPPETASQMREAPLRVGTSLRRALNPDLP